MVYEDLLFQFTEMSKQILGDNLVGIYLHGSAAMDCFNPQKSDLDLILVVEHDIPDSEKLAFLVNVVSLNEEAPVKGIELSIVKKEYCNPFVYPTPFELHFSCAHLQRIKEKPEDYVKNMHGTDKDLAAHFTVIRKFGVVLYGAGIGKVFGEVPAKDYLDSIWADVENAFDEILDNPLYVVLNLCRVLAYLREDLVLSKKAGGEWGIKTLPREYHALIKNALECYETDREMKVDPKLLQDFAKQMLAQIDLLKNLDRLHTTKLGIERIGRNLSLNTEDVEEWCKERIQSPEAAVTRRGKNWYVRAGGCCITVNAGSYTIITAHKEKEIRLKPNVTSYDILSNYYGNYNEDGRLSSQHGMVEYLTTMRYIEKYLCPGMRIIEIGAGTGRYSHTLAGMGYHVDAVELVEHNIEIFKQNITEGEPVTVTQGNAIDLKGFEDGSYDMTLLLGPMYHLFTEQDQKQALTEAMRVTKVGGIVYVAYCNNDATIIQFAFQKGMIRDSHYKELIDPHTFKCHSNPEELFQLYRREDIDRLMEGLPAERLHYLGTDMATNFMREYVDAMDDELFELYLRYHFSICERRDMVGATHHILDVFRKLA